MMKKSTPFPIENKQYKLIQIGLTHYLEYLFDILNNCVDAENYDVYNTHITDMHVVDHFNVAQIADNTFQLLQIMQYDFETNEILEPEILCTIFSLMNPTLAGFIEYKP